MSNERPNLKLVPDKPDRDSMSLAELAREAAKEVKQEAEKAREAKLAENVERFNEINSNLAEVDPAISKLQGDLKEQALEKLKPVIDPVLTERDELLKDPETLKKLVEAERAKEFADIEDLTAAAGRAQGWNRLTKLCRAAEKKGYLRELPENARGNVSFHRITFPDTGSKPQRELLHQLKAAIKQKADELGGKKKFSNRPKLKK
jgi:hypothetical protein